MTEPLTMDEMIASLRVFCPRKTDEEIREEVERSIAELRGTDFWWDERELIKASEAIAHD